MKIKNLNILIYGMSESGIWASRLAKKYKADAFLYDDDFNKTKQVNVKGCFLVQRLDENLISNMDIIVVSPSIEKDNPHLILANKNKVKIMSELEFAASFTKNLIAVTGTNGKTTTVQLITSILNTKKKTIACGNIGYPLSRAVLEKKNHTKVVEVSSFMLENAETFSPHIATITNIEADHLIRHKTMEEYKKLKLNIFNNLTGKDYAIINLDGKICPSVKGQIITYSYNHHADVYMKGGNIYLHNDRICAVNELQIKGKHNVYNVMCAVCFAYLNKIPLEEIRQAVISFKAEQFRVEKVGRVNDINFINDSKSTNIASTLASVDTIKGSIILLLGGSKKSLDYSQLFKKLSKRVKMVVAYGEIKNDLFLANDNKFKFAKFDNLKEAFDHAVKQALPNDNILFSPSSASYDQYISYIERGKDFNDRVKAYEESFKQR